MSGLFGMTDEPDIREPRNRRAAGIGIIAVVVLVVVIAFVLAKVVHGFTGGGGDYTGEGSGSVQVTIPSGASAAAIGQALAAKEVVRSASSFTSAAAENPRSRSIQPGVYNLHEHMKASLALALMLKPSSLVSYTVLVPEGFTVKEIVDTIVAHTPITQDALHAALQNPAQLGLPSWANGHVEGFLFPATYTVQPGETAVEVLKAMVTRFDQAETDDKLAQGAARLHMSEYDVLTLASMVQAEARLPQDFPKIAEVFLNRLRDNMTLGSDATLIYALGHSPLTQTDLETPNPYNTRLNHGLPPTPINSPGDLAIQGVLHHATSPYLYFVTIDKAGHTAYATTLSQFNNLVAQSRSNGVS